MRTNGRTVVAGVLRALLITVTLVLLYFTAPVDGTLSLTAGVLLGVGLLAFTVLLPWQIRSVTRSQTPWLRALEVFATAIPFLLLLFATSYFLLAHNDEAAFSAPLTRLDALYFTITAFATVGFGDIAARSETARAIVTVQMVADLIVIGLGARLLVGAVDVGLARRAKDGGVPEGQSERVSLVTRRSAGSR